MKEKWKDIKGYEGLYQVSDCGNVRSLTRKVECQNGVFITKKGRVLKPWDNNGYLLVDLNKGGKRYCSKVHRLVAEAFIANVFNKDFVNHKDGCKSNNNVSNLEWVTFKENMNHAMKNGLIKRSDESGKKKVSVCEINSSGNIRCFESVSEAQKITGATRQNIKKVIDGKRTKAKGSKWFLKEDGD